MKTAIALLALLVAALACKGHQDPPVVLLGNEEVALTVNGHPITVEQFLEARKWFQHLVEYNKSVLSRVVPDGDPSLNRSSFSPFDPTATYTEGNLIVIVERIFEYLFERHSLDAIILSFLIEEYAPYALGIDAGFTIADEEVQAEVDKRREQYELQKEYRRTENSLPDPEPDPETGELVYRGYYIDHSHKAEIEVYGEDYYWTTLYPEIVRRDGINAMWWKQHFHDGMSEVDITRTVYEVRRWLVQEAVVEITGQVEINATVDEARACYLDREKKSAETICDPLVLFTLGLDCENKE